MRAGQGSAIRGQDDARPRPGSKKVTAPWPYILQVQGLRVRNHRPKIKLYSSHEYDENCKFTHNKSTGKVTANCTKSAWPSCDGHSAGGFCLRVPEARVGQSAELIDFNFFDKNLTVRLRNRKNPFIVYQIKDVVVCGDSKSPKHDGSGKVIADGRVKDRLTFSIPTKTPDGTKDFVPGVYMVDVIMKNTAKYARSDGIVPKSFSTSDINIHEAGLLDIKPSMAHKYWLRVPDAHCYEETDGEWFSDEIRITASVACFFTDATGARAENQILQMPDVMSDADEGDDFAPNWDLVGSPLAPESLPGCTVIALVGYEVDDEDYWKGQIDTWSSAFSKVMGEIWDLIKGHVQDIAGGLAKLGVTWGLIGGAIAIVVVLAIAAIYAAWAPPDLMLLDLIVLEEEDLWYLTQADTPLPASSTEKLEDVTITTVPEAKVLYEYTEERRYRSDGEGSEYGLRFAYRRT